MTAPEHSHASWENLTPWEKAAEWYEAAPHIADEVMALAKEHAQHQWNLERDHAGHQRLMDTRIWITQMVGLGVGLLNVAALVVLAWHYADAGHVWPGLTMFGAGTGLTAGVYGFGRAIGTRNLQSIQSRGHARKSNKAK